MRCRLTLPLALGLFMVSAAFTTPARAGTANERFQTEAPDGFEDLQSERTLMLDVYFGGEKVGVARAIVTPGYLTFDRPGQVARLIPNVSSLAEVTAAFAGELPTNTAFVCSPSGVPDCGRLRPTRAGVILDEDQFRVDLFVDPALLDVVDEEPEGYLDDPDGGPSLISLFGATVSGSSRGDRSYHVQNRSIASLGSLRLRSDSALATESSLSFDNLSLEADRFDWRYRGGLFWAPGSELVGRRKIAGVGVATQLDTRIDKSALMGTPVTVFLGQPGRVELLIDGRVVASRIYSAGQRLIDTSQLPDGSYELVVRVQEDGGSLRTERRFFTKGTMLAPLGRPLFSAFAGLLQTDERGVSVERDTLFYQASANYRVTPALGIDATLIGSQHKAILEAGSVVATPIAWVRVAALASTAGDTGAILRASTVGRGPFALSFDLRKIKSRDDRPLLPVSGSRGTFSEDAHAGVAYRGTYTQAVATIGYRFRDATVRLLGTYRRDGGQRASYNVAASLDVPVVRTRHWDLRLNADVRKSEEEVSSFVGVRFLMTGAGMAVSGRTGLGHRSGSGRQAWGLVAETQAGWSHDLADFTHVSSDVALGDDLDGGYARGSSHLRSPLVNVRADALHQYGSDGATQFTASADTGFAIGGGAISTGARETNDAAAIIEVTGGEAEQTFDVLVDEVVRGTVVSGGSLALFLPPYEAYRVRLRPHASQIAGFDTASRTATLFPGNVAHLRWQVTPLVVLFGRVLDTEGQPLASADVRGPHGIGRTDESGYFQIEARRDDMLHVSGPAGAKCSFAVPGQAARKGYISGGDLLCS